MKLYAPPQDGDLTEIKIEVTRDCPLGCIHCSSNASAGNPLQLSRESVLSLVSQAAEMKVKSIVFSGGEPLVWPWLRDAVSECANRKLGCSIYSTGIDRQGEVSQIGLLAERGLGRIVFSLYAFRKEDHEWVTKNC